LLVPWGQGQIGAGLQMQPAKLLPSVMNCVTTSGDGGDFWLLIVQGIQHEYPMPKILTEL